MTVEKRAVSKELLDGLLVCAGGVELRHSVKSLEAFGQFDGHLRHLDHDRTLSNTRPKNQKFSTPAHSA